MKSMKLGRGLDALLGEMDEAYENEGSHQDLVLELSLKDIRPNPFQPRKEFDEESWRSYLESVGAIIMKSPFIWRNRKLVSDLMQIEHDLNAGAKWLDSVRALLREEVKTEKIRHQSLVIASLLDPLLPLTMEVYNRLKNKELFVIANSGHQSPVERPTVWNKRVELFLKSI